MNRSEHMDQIRIGAFELYPSERRLCSAGKAVEIGARAFDLLLVLVENHGRLVSKNTLLERVWPRLVVDENNLPAQVASLRRVLGAGAIHTVPGFGYRLELQVATPAPGPSAEDPEHKPAVRREPPRLTVPRRAWPLRLGPMIGRDGDVRAIQEALTRSSLVTIVGGAGVGKTRLAQEILAREAEKADPVAWVSLGPHDQEPLVLSSIALALGLALPDDQDAFTSLRQALEDVPLLLILDRAEHLGDALAEPLAALIQQTHGVRALVTSQVPLGITSEVVYRLAALPFPDSEMGQQDACQYAAVTLFVQRAAAADRRFELSESNARLVAQICKRLDGIPLALELAAARVPALGLATLLERLDDRFRLLRQTGRHADPRHGALHAAFDWSYGLLTKPEQMVFNRLGAFAGSFSLKAAARCVADQDIDASEAIDLIGRLVDRSLVTVLAVDPPRYTLLETARTYALDRLTLTLELDATRGRMARTMLELLDLAYQEYWSLDEAIWLHRYQPELDNVRAVLDWSIGHDRELGVGLFGSAWPLFAETDLYAEGRARYAQVLALLSDELPRARIGRFWDAIAAYDSTQKGDRARYAAELAADMHAATSDTRAHYFALMQLAVNPSLDCAAAQSSFDAAKRLEDPAWPARLLAHGALSEGELLTGAGRFAQARTAYQRAVRLALTTSERQALLASVYIVELDVACGDIAAALQLGRPLAASLRHIGRRETRFDLLLVLASALLIGGELDEARAMCGELHELAVRFDSSKLYTALDTLAFLACQERRFDDSRRIAHCSHVAHEAREHLRRRPVEERMRAAVVDSLNQHLGPKWAAANAPNQHFDVAAACALALGLADRP
jgi:predicted ATPase/DNA-binding winged helix-turn-helix (wHTH) protein